MTHKGAASFLNCSFAAKAPPVSWRCTENQASAGSALLVRCLQTVGYA